MSYRIPPSLDEADQLAPLEAPRWYVVCAIGGRERPTFIRLAETMKARDRLVYLPCEKRVIRHAGRKTSSDRALFAGYMFAQACDEDMHVIRGVHGVRGFLSRATAQGRTPVPAPAEFVACLALAEAFGAFDTTLPSTPMFKPEPGASVRVTGGQFQGMVGKITQVKGERRVRVLFEACGLLSAGPAELDRGLLAAA